MGGKAELQLISDGAVIEAAFHYHAALIERAVPGGLWLAKRSKTFRLITALVAVLLVIEEHFKK